MLDAALGAISALLAVDGTFLGLASIVHVDKIGRNILVITPTPESLVAQGRILVVGDRVRLPLASMPQLHDE